MAPTCPVEGIEGIEGIEGTTSNKAHDSSTQQSVTSQSFSSFLPTSFMVESMSVTTAASDEDIPSFIRSFVHSFIRFNSIQFNSIQFNSFIHTYICITSTPWGREGFQPKRGYKQLQTELRNHRICNDEHLFLNNSSIIDVQLCVINYTVHPRTSSNYPTFHQETSRNIKKPSVQNHKNYRLVQDLIRNAMTCSNLQSFPALLYLPSPDFCMTTGSKCPRNPSSLKKKRQGLFKRLLHLAWARLADTRRWREWNRDKIGDASFPGLRFQLLG